MRRWSGLLQLIACLFLALFLAPAPPGPLMGSGGEEVQRFLWNNSVQFHWDIAPGADSYNVYRSNIAAVRVGNYGSCLASLIAVTSNDSTNPPLGGINTYLVTAVIGATEGTLGFRSSGVERPNNTPCTSAVGPRIDPITPNGPQSDGVIQGVEAPRNPGIANDLTGLAGGGVYLHTGEFFAQAVDLEIPGRGMNFKVERTYRTQIKHDGPLGFNWTFSYDRRIFPSGSNLLYLDGAGRMDLYQPVGSSRFEPVTPGIYSKIRQNGDGTFTLRERDGTLYNHFALDGSPVQGALKSIQDRLGDVITFRYTPQGVLCTAIDTLGRTISLFYDSNGRLIRVIDFMNRQVRYAYDASGNLVSVTRPSVVGTSTGNDFPIGKTTTYTYVASPGTLLDHNLQTITAPGDGTPVLQNFYNSNDELIQQIYGGTNASGVPAGGTYLYSIALLGGGIRQTSVVDRTGFTTVHTSDAAGHVLQEDVQTVGLRPTDPADFITQHVYNSNGEQTFTGNPSGNQVRYFYDSGSPDLFQRGNLLAIQRVADSRGDGHGGASLPDIFAQYAYEGLYTQQRLIVDPLGRASTYSYDYQEGNPSTNGVNALISTWGIFLSGTSLAIGDVNGDGLVTQIFGNPVVLDQPTVTLAPGGRQQAIAGGPTQAIRTRYRYDALGQIKVEIDAENNVKVYAYNPETDPDGDGTLTPSPIDGRVLNTTIGGYRKSLVIDENPAPYLLPSEIAARDNATNPPPARILNTFSYDPVGNLIASTDGKGNTVKYEVNALGQIVRVVRGVTGTTPGFFAEQIYNARDEIVERRVQDLGDTSGTGGVVNNLFTFDILGQVVEMDQEIGAGPFAVTKYRYDAQGRRTAIIFPEGNQFTMQYDERGLIYRLVRGDNNLDASDGGPSGSSLQVYDYDLNGNPTVFFDGRGTQWHFTYDGVDRRVRSEIIPGTSYFDIFWTPMDALQSIAVVEGTTTRHDAVFQCDELGRLVHVMRSIRDATGSILIEDHDGNGYVDSVNEYDRNSRRSRAQSDSGRYEDYNYDGAGRMIHKSDLLGNVTDFTYDPDNNATDVVEREVTSVGPEVFTTHNQYDELNRLTKTTDNAGNTRNFQYDSRDNLVQVTDALGNTISYKYDAQNHRTQITRDLRAGGTGAGPVVDQIIYRFVADLNGRVTKMIDPNGNATQYAYDTLNRKIRDTFQDGSTAEYGYDANDNVVQVKDPNGTTTSIVYDTADRPFQRNVTVLAPGVHSTTQGYNYDSLNRLIQAINLNDVGLSERATVSFTYDSLNRIRTETTQYGLNPAQTFTYTYDGEANRRMATYPGGETLNYSYDALNRLATVQDTLHGFTAQYSYLGPERIAERRHGNGTRKSYLDPGAASDIGYDGIKRVKAIRHYVGSSTTQAGFNYTYDSESNLTSETRLHDSGRGNVWVYDSAYRLVDFKRDVANPLAEVTVPGSGGTILRRTQYRLDHVGNWIDRNIQDLITGVSDTFGDTPNNLNEYGEKPDDGIPDDFNDKLSTPTADGVNLGHDRNGNLVTEAVRRYEYDTQNRLVQVSDSGVPVVHYVYDALNRRIAKRFPSPTDPSSRFIYDGDRIVTSLALSTTNAETSLRGRYLYGSEGQPLATFDAVTGQLYYLHEDARGNYVMGTNSAGSVVERVTYGAWGEPEFLDAANTPVPGATQSAIRNPFLFGGQTYDPETRFYEKQGGVFAPRYGRHIQRFVPGQQVGPLGQAFNPPMLFPNMQDYIGMNPFWWWRCWFWHPGAWLGGLWSWKPCWWWGGPWGWWWWLPWAWIGVPGGWWFFKPWLWWWCTPFRWWGWQAWWGWPGWWGWWPWWGWGGWCAWLPAWGWLAWRGWWPFWGWAGWCGWWPAIGWWGWCGWWPWWNLWWGWFPQFWLGWWTWTCNWWTGFWGWSGITFWWNWWCWISWWPWSWWNWLGWWCWWGWAGWNPWWWWGWWSWSWWMWVRGCSWWWGWIGWWPWFGWGWIPWWWCGWWCWLGWWGWWLWPWWGLWSWWNWWAWWWGWWIWPGWGWWRWWGWWWPWWGWWC